MPIGDRSSRRGKRLKRLVKRAYGGETYTDVSGKERQYEPTRLYKAHKTGDSRKVDTGVDRRMGQTREVEQSIRGGIEKAYGEGKKRLGKRIEKLAYGSPREERVEARRERRAEKKEEKATKKANKKIKREVSGGINLPKIKFKKKSRAFEEPRKPLFKRNKSEAGFLERCKNKRGGKCAAHYRYGGVIKKAEK